MIPKINSIQTKKKTIQNWERDDGMKLKNGFDHNFISFEANASIPDSRERYRSLLTFASFTSKIDPKLKKIWGIEVCERGWYWWSWQCKMLWWRAGVMWMMMKVNGDLEGVKGVIDGCCGVGFCFCFVTLATCSRQSVIEWPVWPTVYDLCLKFCFVGHPGHWGTGFGVRLIFKYTCSNCNLQSSPWPLRHSIVCQNRVLFFFLFFFVFFFGPDLPRGSANLSLL